MCPVFNDWESLRGVLAQVDALTLPGVDHLRVLVVDDGSTRPPEVIVPPDPKRIGEVVLIELSSNLGHQRAIALGIASAARDQRDDLVIVMDSDGEDDPTDLPRLIEASRAQPDAVIVAQRQRRSEGVGFRLGYFCYQLLFRLAVGRPMRFGNYCAFSASVARRLANTSNTWNHLAATLLRAPLLRVEVPTRRGHRLAGVSSMNVPALVTHGLSAFAVFSDHVFVRLILLSGALAAAAVIGGCVVVGVRLLTPLGIPGWATATLGALFLVILQALIISLIASLQLLSTRSQAGAIPATLIDTFVRERRTLWP